MYMKQLLILLSVVLTATQVFSQEVTYDYKTELDVVFGKALIKVDGEDQMVELKMDAYIPESSSSEKRPAIIYTHGGAFHRGSPRQTYHELGAQDTSPMDYCKKFASLGYACFAISYRMAPQNPIPTYEGYDEADLDMDRLSVLIDQANHVRTGMNLPVLDMSVDEDKEFMTNAVLVAAEDLRTAISFVRSEADRFNIDSDRIILGGFSAGAVTSLNVAYGMKVPVSGLFLISGLDVGFDIPKLLGPEDPPILMFLGQYDLAGAISDMPKFLTAMDSRGIDYSFAWVPGFGHFYSESSVSLSGDGRRMSVGDRIIEFLKELE